MLIKILIILFTFLIGYQLFLALLTLIKNDNLVEGLENQSTNPLPQTTNPVPQTTNPMPELINFTPYTPKQTNYVQGFNTQPDMNYIPPPEINYGQPITYSQPSSIMSPIYSQQSPVSQTLNSIPQNINSMPEDLALMKIQLNFMQQNVNSMQSQINALVQQQADYAIDLVGFQPANITGLE
jgi:hypothetical protein